MKRKNNRFRRILTGLLIISVMISPIQVFAEPGEHEQHEQVNIEELEAETGEGQFEMNSDTGLVFAGTGQWSVRSGRYFYSEDGVQAKGGFVTIGRKTYCFDENGVEQFSWIKAAGTNQYYYFQIGVKDAGFMVTDTTVNGVYLSTDGSAMLEQDDETGYWKLYLDSLCRANRLLNENGIWAKRKAMRLSEAFRYCAYRLITDYFDYDEEVENRANAPDKWFAVRAANDRAAETLDPEYYTIANKQMRGVPSEYGNCYEVNFLFAAMAVTLGYQDVYCRIDPYDYDELAHGWCIIMNDEQEYIYDPEQCFELWKFDGWVKEDAYSATFRTTTGGGYDYFEYGRQRLSCYSDPM